MYQSRSLSRMCRVLLAGIAAIAACAQAAVPASSPFGADASGSFEPTKPLAGGGWQLLSERRASVSRPAEAAAGTPVQVAALPPTSTSAAPSASASAIATPVALRAEPTPVTATAQRDWSVSKADGNYRLLIEKWVREVGWTAAPWELDQDVEIEGADAFTSDFKTAVRRVLSSTELTDYSVKPCFYSNNLVRVVKNTTKCNPTK